MNNYINECVFNFCVLYRYVNKYFSLYPPEILNVINNCFIAIYGLIDKLPFVCDKPIYYNVTKDLHYYGDSNAIRITSDNVILNLGGFKIVGHCNEALIYVENVLNMLITNGKLIAKLCIHVVGSYGVVNNLQIITIMNDNPGSSGEQGPSGIIEKPKKIKHVYNENTSLINIPKNVKYCKKKKFHY